MVGQLSSTEQVLWCLTLAWESESPGPCSVCSSHVLCVLQNVHLPPWLQIAHLWKRTALGVFKTGSCQALV